VAIQPDALGGRGDGRQPGERLQPEAAGVAHVVGQGGAVREEHGVERGPFGPAGELLVEADVQQPPGVGAVVTPGGLVVAARGRRTGSDAVSGRSCRALLLDVHSQPGEQPAAQGRVLGVAVAARCRALGAGGRDADAVRTHTDGGQWRGGAQLHTAVATRIRSMARLFRSCRDVRMRRTLSTPRKRGQGPSARSPVTATTRSPVRHAAETRRASATDDASGSRRGSAGPNRPTSGRRAG
jgi:hypothetical protein